MERGEILKRLSVLRESLTMTTDGDISQICLMDWLFSGVKTEGDMLDGVTSDLTYDQIQTEVESLIGPVDIESFSDFLVEIGFKQP